jgi:predicted anti-sigma-YlaC factor YlaD
MSLDCNQTKERLEALIDQIVDAGLKGEAIESSEDTKSSQLNSLTLSVDCQEHLNQCSDCRNYQAANRMLIEAATVLPILEVPQADLLTASIMQAVMDEPIAEISARTSAMPNTATSKIQSNQYGEIYLVAFSFVAFALASAYGVQLDESLWNIASWLIALILFIALRPLIEKQQQQLEQRHLGTPA